MADYYPVLKKTVAALPQNTGAARREIYQRARKAIVAQLKAYDPPLSPSDITAEQLRLEEAIRKVEAEAARATLGASAPQPSETPKPAPAPAAAATPPAQPPQPTQPPAPAAPATPPPAASSPGEATPPRSPAAEPPRPEPTRAASQGASASPGADTLKAAIDDARKLGTSAESAGRSARRALEGEGPDERKREPTLDTPPPDAPASGSYTQGASAAATGSPKISTGLEGLTGESRAPVGDNRRPLGGTEGRPLPPLDSARPSRLPALLGGAAVLLLVIGLAAVGYSQRDALTDLFAGSDTPQPAPQQTAETPEPEADESRKDSARLLENGETAVAPDARSVTTTRITPSAPSGETSATAPETAPAGESVRAVEPETPAPPAEPATPPAAESPSATAETAQPADPAPAPASDTAIVGQRAFLYEEGPEAGSAGQASSGRTIWDVDTETVDGRTETVLRMRVEVPDRDIIANMSLRPNRDQSLPASHLLEVRFDLPEDFTGQGVAEMPGLVMKTTEEARGDALIGASVKVADGFFWVALSSIPDERERNLQLLRDRAWIDLPMLYENRKRAILTLEKGTPGTRAVEQAVAAWSAE
ncbi:hypothetical protein [Stappia sp.]|uniref:hypothetical protein n=1 Tax=Stappia sp. TaxID=1870903 RepID=UPI0032D99583